MKRTVAALCILGATAAPAAAETSSPGFVRGSGGMSFMSETGGVLGGAIGMRLTRTLHIVVDGGRLTNILPQKIQRDLDAVAREMGSFYGAPLTIDGKAPGLYGMAGLRASRATAQRMKVFVEAGAGVARGTSAITAIAGGVNVSREVRAVLRIKHSERRAMVAVGGGVQIPLTGRLALDLGYRFMRIFTDDPRIDTATMTAGFHWGF